MTQSKNNSEINAVELKVKYFRFEVKTNIRLSVGDQTLINTFSECDFQH